MAKILNVGCGDDTYGSDFIDIAPRRRDVIKCDAGRERFPYRSGTFDEVYSAQMIMYIDNLRHFVDECYRVLKPKGRIYVTSASAGYYGFVSNWYSQRKDDNFYNLQTTESLENLLKASGFKNINASYSVSGGEKSIVPLSRENGIRRSLGLYKQELLGLLSKRMLPYVIATATK